MASLREQDRWKWLSVVPHRFYLSLPYLGILVGRFVSEPMGGYFGLFFGLAVGIPLQVKQKSYSKRGAGQPCETRVEQIGLDMHRGRNLGQLAAGIVFGAGGAVAGFTQLPFAERWGGAVAGGILGFVGGVFLSGITIMLGGMVAIATKMWVKLWQTAVRRLQRSTEQSMFPHTSVDPSDFHGSRDS